MAQNVLSLFSGIGGIDYAFHAAGFKIVGQVEIDEYCKKILQKHWPHARRFDDVRTFNRESWGDETIDVICAGFPCQPHSIAGSRQSANDSRNLWPDVARIVGEFRPAYVLLENVAGILAPAKTVGAKQAYALNVLGDLAALGYDAIWATVSAAAFGAPHIRERWFVLAYTHSDGLVQPSPAQEQKHTQNQERNASVQVGQWPAIVHETRPDSRLYGIVARNLQRFTGNEPELGRGIHGVSARMDGFNHTFPSRLGLTPEPAEPPRMVASRQVDANKRVKALGNAVVPQCVYPFALSIAEAAHLTTTAAHAKM